MRALIESRLIYITCKHRTSLIKAVKFLRNQVCLSHVQRTLKLLFLSSANLKNARYKLAEL